MDGVKALCVENLVVGLDRNDVDELRGLFENRVGHAEGVVSLAEDQAFRVEFAEDAGGVAVELADDQAQEVGVVMRTGRLEERFVPLPPGRRRGKVADEADPTAAFLF